MSETVTITLPGSLVAQTTPLLQQSGLNLDALVCRIIQVYVGTWQRRQIQERLARDYDELAIMYDDLAAELADETWLPLENEALLHTETDLAV